MKKFLFDTMETYLENGLRLITIRKETQIASLNIGVMVGAVCEEKQERGISHFIEHMLFKGTVNRDNEKLNGDLEDLSFQKINDMAFTRSPLKIDVIGKEEIVKSISREELIRYYNNHYVSNNTVITVVSSYEHEYVIELVKKYFSQWKRKEVNKPILNFEKNKDKFEITHRDNMEQSTIIYLYTFNDLTKKEELALRILNHKFGESSNSILFRELREDRGLAYDIYTSLDLTNNLKTLYIYAAVSPEDVDATIETINNCIEKIKEEIIVFDGNTINLMKKVFKTAIASTLEDSTDLGNYVVHQAMEEDNLYQFNEDMENLNYIVAQDLYEVAKKVLNKPTIHVLLCDRE